MTTRTQTKSRASRLVDKQLARYRAMRDFHITAEPTGKSRSQATPDLPFVVQKHAATRLHYDFRLGWNGVLKSWAVTKGPSFFPGDKRLAVQVEDHPMEYAGFEGTIPKGQYGGGTVMVWDFGDWKPLVDVDRGLREGSLKFELHGKKLKGAWALVRMKGRNERPDKPNWLLIKERDEFVQAEMDPPVTETAQNSAVTDRTMEEIAASADHVWQSGSPEEHRAAEKGTQPAPTREPAGPVIKKVRRPGNETAQILKAAPRERFPGFIAPQLADPATTAPDQPDWIHELKLDGYRIQIHLRSSKKDGRMVRDAHLFTRSGLDWTHRMPDLSRAAAATFPVIDAIVDGEAVVLNAQGIPDFGALQAAFQEGGSRGISYFAFDLLHLDGRNLRGLTLVQRKQLLAGLLMGDRSANPLRLSEHFEAKGSTVLAEACALGAEGIVSKLASSVYQPGCSSAWRKVKCNLEQEFVILGFTAPAKGGHGIGALLLGYYEHGKPRYAGRVGTGFTQKVSGELRTRLNRLETTESGLGRIPPDARRGVHWVKPELVAQVVFAAWTKDNLVRQAAFKGLREDKPAEEVERESVAGSWSPGSGQPGAPSSRPGIQRKRVARAEQRQRPRTATSLPITHPDKILDADSGTTKGMLAEYYVGVAECMLPHIADRPLSVVRCPDGTSGQCFFQKHSGMGMPEGVKTVSVPNRKTGKVEAFLTVDSVDGLVGLAQMGVLEIHPWGSRNESLEMPDRIVFDLDPDAAISWSTLADSAKELRERLKQLGLASFLKHTGGKGLHVVVPVDGKQPWPVVKEFAHQVVLRMEKDRPDLYVTKMTKAIRTGRIYLDYLRNEREATSIAPFSPRARSGIPVAVTMDWKELAKERPVFHVADFAHWRSRLKRDPWKEMGHSPQRLSTTVLRDAGVRDKR